MLVTGFKLLRRRKDGTLGPQAPAYPNGTMAQGRGSSHKGICSPARLARYAEALCSPSSTGRGPSMVSRFPARRETV